jgi:hypothetical protein
MESNESVLRDGFRVLRDQYSPPSNTTQLAADMKRKVTICNLFLNYKLSINNIARTLDETYKNAVSTLIEQGIIQDRRSVCREERQLKQSSLFGFRLKKSGSTDSLAQQRQTPGSSKRMGSSQDREG